MKSAPSTYACLDRVARDRVVASMDRFLYGNATAFEFDEEIFAASEEAIDETVKELVYEPWHFYDDVTDHKVALSRSEWDYLQRIKLVLQSNYIAAVTKTNIWLPAQLAAFVVVCLYAYSIQALGFGYANFLLLAIPAGIASMLISRWRRQSVKKCTIAQRSRRPLYEIIAPFNSLEELAEERQAPPKFSKQRYPG